MLELKKRAKSIVENLSPSDSIYKTYRSECSHFEQKFLELQDCDPLGWLKIKKIRWKNSKVFQRPYLTAIVDEQWLKEAAPTFSAVAVQSMKFADICSPPLILFPSNFNNSKYQSLQGVFEHETVHINQFLFGKIPLCFKKSSKNLMGDFIDLMYAEYQAYVIEEVNHPQLSSKMIKEKGFSLDEWCSFRAFTQVMESVVYEYAQKDKKSLQILLKFLKEFSSKIDSEFLRVGFDKKLIKKFKLNLPVNILKSITILKRKHPHLDESEKFLRFFCETFEYFQKFPSVDKAIKNMHAAQVI